MSGIKQIFDNPLTTTRNASLLAQRAGVGVKAATDFLRDQAAPQIMKRATKPPDTAFAPTGDERGVYLADVIYLREYAGVNKKRTCIFTLMGVNSRYVYAEGLTAATAAKTAEAMTEMLKQNKRDAAVGAVASITKIRSDGGPELAGAFAALLQARGIPLEKGQPGTHARLARLDRFHGMLRRLLGAHFARTNSNVWIDVLPALVENHNTAPSRPLKVAGPGITPATVGTTQEERLRSADMKRAGAVRQRTDTLKIKPGSRVRILTSALKEAPKYVKGQEAVWTPTIYTVVGRAGVNSFLLDVEPGATSIYPAHALQPVGKALGQVTAGPKVNKKWWRHRELRLWPSHRLRTRLLWRL